MREVRTDLWTRRKFIVGSGSLALPLNAACARFSLRQTNQNIGLLVSVGYEPMIAAFRTELARLGYEEGRNVRLYIREWESNAESAAAPAGELVRSGVGLIVAGALPQALAVQALVPAMPMVIVTCPGMVSNGFAKSLDRPGGNVTGMDELPPGVTARRLELLKAIAPAVTRVGLLSTTPGRGGHEIQLADAIAAAPVLGLQVKPYRATTVAELERALKAIVADGMNGLANFQGRLSLANRQQIVGFAAEHRLPAVYQATLFAEAGGLMSWAPDLVDQYRTAAQYVDAILKGAKPSDLPIRYPQQYYLTINRRAAANLGLILPARLSAKAHRIIN